MTANQIFLLIIVPITFTAFVLTYTMLMWAVHKRECLLISSGNRDSQIIDFFKKERKKSKARVIVSRITDIFFIILVGLVIFVGVYTATYANNFPVFGRQVKLVASNSMGSVHKNNEAYIKENNLNNQFKYDDLIIIESLPIEKDIMLYDIVTYYNEERKMLIVHRIVNIEATNEGLLYTLKGDANPYDDTNKINYDDMRGIYKGQKLNGVGVIIRFIQSGFGIIAIGISLYVFILDEILSKKLSKLDKKRLSELERKAGNSNRIPSKNEIIEMIQEREGSKTKIVYNERTNLPIRLKEDGKTYAMIYDYNTMTRISFRLNEEEGNKLDSYHTVLKAKFPEKRNWFILYVDDKITLNEIYGILMKSKDYVKGDNKNNKN